MKHKKTIHTTIRSLHRDIGFFVLGLTVIYCISGVLLTFRDTNFLKTETLVEAQLLPHLTSAQLQQELRMKRMRISEDSDTTIVFSNGQYDKISGLTTYTEQSLPTIVNKMNSLHKTPSAQTKHWFTVFYGLCLLFLALSSLIMYKPQTKLFKRGVITTIAGLLFAAAVLLW